MVKLYATPSFAIVGSKDKRGYDGFSPRESDLVEQLKERLGSSTKDVFPLANILSLIVRLRTENTSPKSLSDRKFQRAVVENKILQEIVLTATYPFDCKRYHSTLSPSTNLRSIDKMPAIRYRSYSRCEI